MRETLSVYGRAVWKHSRQLISGAIAGAGGIAFTIHPVAVPAWVWFLIALASFLWVNLLAFHELRLSYKKDVATLQGQVLPSASRDAQRLAIKALASEAIAAIDFESGYDATEWFSTTARWLRASLGEGEAAQFQGFDYGVVYPTRAREWLEELIGRADGILVLPTFDPGEWQDPYA